MRQRVARRCKFYVIINAFILSVGLFTYAALLSMDRSGESPGMLLQLSLVYSVGLLRIVAMIKWFDMIASTKPHIHGKKRIQLTAEQTRSIYCSILRVAVPTECASFWFANQTAGSIQGSLNWQMFLVEFATFIPKSLLFEVTFDFFHYVMHRACHYIPWLYKNVHKRHHLHLHPCPLSTYAQDGMDLILTNVLPFCLAWSFDFSMSGLQLHLLFAYKTYVEVAGHSGLDVKGVSFPQLPLLNNVTGICSRIHDHDLHHTHQRYNFAKRFSLWDKVFHTFREGRAVKVAAR
uniref:Fatty acid hydroxylase domain-containing protein n=1 Tax=Peronospora matthiolae TaxID=2874970 RepID=A0AAV1T2X9_9STRA